MLRFRWCVCCHSLASVGLQKQYHAPCHAKQGLICRHATPATYLQGRGAAPVLWSVPTESLRPVAPSAMNTIRNAAAITSGTAVDVWVDNLWCPAVMITTAGQHDAGIVVMQQGETDRRHKASTRRGHDALQHLLLLISSTATCSYLLCMLSWTVSHASMSFCAACWWCAARPAVTPCINCTSESSCASLCSRAETAVLLPAANSDMLVPHNAVTSLRLVSACNHLLGAYCRQFEDLDQGAAA